MRTLAPWTEQFQHFVTEIRNEFSGDLHRHTREVWQRSLERLSVAARVKSLACWKLVSGLPVE